MTSELSSFAARLRDLISAGFQAGHFDSLALELFTLQYQHNAAYRKICDARGLTPAVVKDWPHITAVPTVAFKEMEMTSLAPSERNTVFHSSGTTAQTPSRHFHCAESLAVYEMSLWKWFEQSLFANPKPGIRNPELIIMTPTPEKAPNSSLVHMFETVRQKLGGSSCSADRIEFQGALAADGSWTLNFNTTIAALRGNAKGKTQNAKLILGTAFSFVHLLDYLAKHHLRLRLPVGSRVMETGGYKNRSRTMPKTELHSLITERLGVPLENIICEYGMSELSSQAYSATSGKWQVTLSDAHYCHPSLATRHFQFPPWARVQIISPETGREVGECETGLIRIFDLANVFSVAAIQTEDLAIRRGDAFELIGRAELAESRGCSLLTA
jgi:hypothetical protein